MIKNDNLAPAGRYNFAVGRNGDGNTDKTSKLRHTYRLERRGRSVRSVNVSSDNRYLIITYEENIPRIRVVDLEKLEFLPHDYDGHTATVRLTDITADNRAFHTAAWDGSSRRFEIESGKCTLIFSGFGRSPSCFLSEDQKYLFTASYDSDCDIDAKNAGRCWELSSGKIINIYKHTRERICPEAIDIAYEAGRVYTGSDDGCLYCWSLHGSKPLMNYFTSTGSIRKIALSRNFIAAACSDFSVRVHYKKSGECYRHFLHNQRDVREVRISGDETRLWSATDNGTVSCFDLLTGKLIYRKKVHTLWIWSLALMQNEKILVTGSGDGSVAFLSASSGRVLASLYNLPYSKDLLITCPPDKAFPTGFFYTTNKDLIQVFREDRETQCCKILSPDDPAREAYINKLNLKNLIITRLKSSMHYNTLTENYMHDMKLLGKMNEKIALRSLKA